MVLTADVSLPEESELTVEEVNLSTATLRAGSFHLGKYCEQANNVSKIDMFYLKLKCLLLLKIAALFSYVYN